MMPRSPKRRHRNPGGSSSSAGSGAGGSVLEDQSLEQKKKIRNQYRKLHQKVLEDQRNARRPVAKASSAKAKDGTGGQQGDEDEDEDCMTFSRLKSTLDQMGEIFNVRNILNHHHTIMQIRKT